MDTERTGKGRKLELKGALSRLNEWAIGLNCPLPHLPDPVIVSESDIRAFGSSPEGRTAEALYPQLIQVSRELPPSLPQDISVRFPRGRKGRIPAHIRQSLTARMHGRAGSSEGQEGIVFKYPGSVVADWMGAYRSLRDTGRAMMPEVSDVGRSGSGSIKGEGGSWKGRAEKGAVAGTVVLGGILSSCREQPPAVVRETPETQMTPTVVSIEPSPTQPPTPEPTIGPTPTVVKRDIETIPRELGGAESEIFSVSQNGETQQGIRNTLPDGEQWFLIGVYPDLPGVEEQVDFVNEVVGYDGEVFLTAVPALKEHPGALPFYQAESMEGFPNGALLYVEDGEVVAQVDPFEHFQENEVSIRFDAEKGKYEFLDAEGNTTRTEEVFSVSEPTPEVQTPPAYGGLTPELNPQSGQYEVSIDGRVIARWDVATNSWDPQEFYVNAGDGITGYDEAGGERVKGTVVQGKEFIILQVSEVEEETWIKIRVLEGGGEGWILADSNYLPVGEPGPEPLPPAEGPMIPESERISPASNPRANRDNGLLERNGNIYNFAGEDKFGWVSQVPPHYKLPPKQIRGAWYTTGDVVRVDYNSGEIVMEVGGGRQIRGILNPSVPAWIWFGQGVYRQENIWGIKVGDNLHFYVSSEGEIRALLADSNQVGHLVGVGGVK